MFCIFCKYVHTFKTIRHRLASYLLFYGPSATNKQSRDFLYVITPAQSSLGSKRLLKLTRC